MFGAFQKFGRMGAPAGAPWSERALWPSGASSPGLWIDPAFVSSEFQDSAGTTALSTIGTVLDSSNPVGLIFDRKGGLQLGPELVTNGDFSDGATGWAGAGVWSFSGGAATHSGGVAAYITQYSALSGYLGKILAITYTVTENVGGRGLLLIGAYWSTGTINIPSTVGTHTVYAASSTVDFWLYCNAVGTSLTIDNISVREIAGIHLSQSTSAARPVASARVNLLDYSEGPVANWLTDGSETDATPIAGYSGSIHFGDNSTTRYAYQTSFVPTAGIVYSVSAVVQMDDNSMPVVGGYNIAGVDLVLVLANTGGSASAVVYPLGGGVYRVSMTAAAIGTNSNFGVLKGTGNSAKGFRITALQANLGSIATYQRVGAASDYDASAGPTYLKFDGVDDSLASATFPAGTLTSSMDCLIAVRRDAATSAVCGLYNAVADATKYFGMAESASGSAAVGTGAGTPTIWVDGTQLAGGTAVTRGTLHTALTPGNWHILELRGLDLSTWTAAGCGLYTSYVLNGVLGKILLFANGQDANRDKARARMAAYFGVTLP